MPHQPGGDSPRLLTNSTLKHSSVEVFGSACMTRGSAKAVVNSLVVSKVDYCNSLLAACTQQQTDKLQRVLNCAARVILGGSKYDHVTPLIHNDLHWLRVPERITFKLLSARLQGTERPGCSLHQVDVCTSLVVHGKIIAALGVKGPPHCSMHSARVRQAHLRIHRSNSLDQST